MLDNELIQQLLDIIDNDTRNTEYNPIWVLHDIIDLGKAAFIECIKTIDGTDDIVNQLQAMSELQIYKLIYNY